MGGIIPHNLTQPCSQSISGSLSGMIPLMLFKKCLILQRMIPPSCYLKVLSEQWSFPQGRFCIPKLHIQILKLDFWLQNSLHEIDLVEMCRMMVFSCHFEPSEPVSCPFLIFVSKLLNNMTQGSSDFAGGPKRVMTLKGSCFKYFLK